MDSHNLRWHPLKGGGGGGYLNSVPFEGICYNRDSQIAWRLMGEYK